MVANNPEKATYSPGLLTTSSDVVARKLILDALKFQTHELRDLYLGNRVPRISVPSSLQFSREFVSTNRPTVVVRAVTHWNALRNWSDATYLAEKAGSSLVTVALSNGRADSPTTLPNGNPCFALPYQRRMPLSRFFQILKQSAEDPDCSIVPYLQFQNSSLTKELPQLLPDVDAHLPWATEAFGGALPEAVNLWIGDGRSITSWHRDHYENIYVVVTGKKTFRLLPPTDSYRMALRRWPMAAFRPKLGNPSPQQEEQQPPCWRSNSSCPCRDGVDQEDGKNFELPRALEPVLCEPPASVLWSSITPRSLHSASHRDAVQYVEEKGEKEGETVECGRCSSSREERRHPALAAQQDGGNGGEDGMLDADDLPAPLEVTVSAGEVLYLPCEWWHEVHHGGGTGSDASDDSGDLSVAVNYWYDMTFDCKYVAGKTVEALAVAAELNQS
jgi:hypothetical protein